MFRTMSFASLSVGMRSRKSRRPSRVRTVYARWWTMKYMSIPAPIRWTTVELAIPPQKLMTNRERMKFGNLIGIPVTNLSVNPARSTGPAMLVQGWAIHQLWLFWVAPIAGAIVAGLIYLVAFEPKPGADKTS